jgi:hypothetical protein
MDHDLIVVQVHRIHLIDLINIQHIVVQNQDYKDRIEPYIIKK